jgi:galactosamine-6-phosphate isomerase
MRIQTFNNTAEMADFSSNIIVNEINLNPAMLLCTATGGSPSETYTQLVNKKDQFNAKYLRIIKLDEWGGVPMDNEQTCEQYLQKHLVQPLQIDVNRYFAFNSNPFVPEEEVARMQGVISKQGPVDVCVLGLGMNGHIAFNEPASFLNPHCHIAELSVTSMQHPMAEEMDIKPWYGLTLGMADILQSKKIILLINGTHKKKIASDLMSGKITSSLPASFLWLHPDVYCCITIDAVEVHNQ